MIIAAHVCLFVTGTELQASCNQTALSGNSARLVVLYLCLAIRYDTCILDNTAARKRHRSKATKGRKPEPLSCSLQSCIGDKTERQERREEENNVNPVPRKAALGASSGVRENTAMLLDSKNTAVNNQSLHAGIAIKVAWFEDC